MLLRVLLAVGVAVALWLVALFILGDFLLRVEAADASVVLRVLGVRHVRVSNTIYVETGRGAVGFVVEPHCSSLVTYTLYLLVVMLLPLPLRRRLYWLVVGFTVFYAVNLARIVLIVAVAYFLSLEATRLVHTVVAPLLMLGVLAGLLAMVFMERLRGRSR